MIERRGRGMDDHARHPKTSGNDHDHLAQHDIVRHFQSGHHQWAYKGNGLVESYRLQHPETKKTLALIERHDRRKGYFDGNVELLLRTSERGSVHAAHYDLPFKEALARAERHADAYLRREKTRTSGLGPTELKLRPDLIEGLVYPQNFPYYIWHWHFAAKIDEKSPVTNP